MTLLDDLRGKVGLGVIISADEADAARHLRDFNYTAPAGLAHIALAYPRNVQEVSTILAACNAAGVKVTPQGGMTGMAGGGVPFETSLILSLERMRAIEEVDLDASTMTVQAGVVLEAVQNAALEAGLFFPLDIGGRGSAQVGGLASTNAGGNRVLRYGMMRDLVLGVEAVLADGTVISHLNKMIKNNTGYDTRQLFIGSEGTLGVITRLVLKLSPPPKSQQTGLVAVADYPAVLALLRHVRAGFGGTLSAFEVMWPQFYRLGTVALDRRPPLPVEDRVYVLMETMGADEDADAARFEAVIAAAMEAQIVQDAVLAQSSTEARALWAIRDCPGEFPKVFWPQIAFDIAVPTGEIDLMKREIETGLHARWPDVEIVFFGHVADANLHFSVKLDEAKMTERDIDDVVYAAVGARRGSVSAEHGIGHAKRDYLHYSRSPEDIALMRTLKAALDPKGILNPGKVL